jgi:hypothetical protein
MQPVPVAPDREKGKWEQITDARNDREDNAPSQSGKSKAEGSARNDKPTIRRKAYVAKPGREFAGITVTEYSDGTTVVKPEKTAPGEKDTLTDTDRHELLQIALEHLRKQAGHKANKPADTPAKGAEKTMEKSQSKMPAMLIKKVLKGPRTPIFKSKPSVSEPRDMSLMMLKRTPRTTIAKVVEPVPEKIEKAQQEPEKFDLRPFDVATMPAMERVGYLSRRFDAQQLAAQQLQKSQSEAPKTTAEQVTAFYSQFGKTLDQTMTLQEFNKLDGHQRRAMTCGLNPYAENIPFSDLSNPEMIELAATIKRRIHGIADPPKDTSRKVQASQWD